MKQPIKWHQTNLESNKAYLKNKQENLRELAKEVVYVAQKIEKYEFTINKAISEGKTHFDRDKYNVKRVKS